MEQWSNFFPHGPGPDLHPRSIRFLARKGRSPRKIFRKREPPHVDAHRVLL